MQNIFDVADEGDLFYTLVSVSVVLACQFMSISSFMHLGRNTKPSEVSLTGNGFELHITKGFVRVTNKMKFVKSTQ